MSSDIIESSFSAKKAQSLGNAAFFDGKFPEAIKHYTDAIRLDPSNHLAFSNRSACQFQLEDYESALKDSVSCMKLNPHFVKGYSRRANALVAMKRFPEAQSILSEGLSLDPSNQRLLSEMETVNKQVASFGNQQAQPPKPAAAAAPSPPRSAAPSTYTQEPPATVVSPRQQHPSPHQQSHCPLHPSEIALMCTRFSQYVPSVMSKMDHDGFTKFLVEGFAHSFFSREAFDHSCKNVPEWISSGHLLKGLDTRSVFFRRFFEFFDRKATGRVTLKDTLRGATQVVGVEGGLQGQLEFLFHLFDVQNKRSFNQGDAAALLEAFALLFVELSSNVFSMERPFLASNGTSENQLNTHLDQIRSILPNLSQLIAAETKNLFGGLEMAPGQPVDLQTWCAQFSAIDELPKLTRKLLSIAVGITNNGLNAIVRTEKPSSQRLITTFIEAAPTGLLNNQNLKGILISAMAKAFLSAETCHELASEVQLAVEDGRLRTRLDLSSRLMQWLITQGFARSPSNGQVRGLTLQDFIASVDRFEQYLQEPARTFLMMIQGPSGHISTKQVEGMLRDMTEFTTQLNLNLLSFEATMLQQRGIAPNTIKSREMELCRVQEHIADEVADTMRKLLNGNTGREFEMQDWLEMFRQNGPIVCRQVTTLLKGVLMLSGGTLPATDRFSYVAAGNYQQSPARSQSPHLSHAAAHIPARQALSSHSPSRSPQQAGFETLAEDLSNAAQIFDKRKSPQEVQEEVRQIVVAASQPREASEARVSALLEKYSPPRQSSMPRSAEPVPTTSLRSWLSQHELSEWATALEREAVDLSTLTLLSDADLKDIGLPLGHRRRMLHAITQLEAAAAKPMPLQQNNAEHFYRPVESEMRAGSQQRSASKSASRSVSRSPPPQSVYAPVPEADFYKPVEAAAEVIADIYEQAEVEQKSEPEGKQMEMADGSFRMISSPSKERKGRSSSSRSPGRSSPQQSVSQPRVGPRPPLHGEPTKFDSSLTELENEFEKILGKPYDPPEMMGTLKVKGLPNGLCVGIDAHRQVLQTEKGRQAMYGAGGGEGGEQMPEGQQQQQMPEGQQQQWQGMRGASPQRLHPAMVGRQGTPQDVYQQGSARVQQQQEIHPAMRDVYQQGSAREAVMQQQRQGPPQGRQQPGPHDGPGAQGAQPSMQQQQKMAYEMQMASLVSQYEAQGGTSHAGAPSRFQYDRPIQGGSAFRM